MTILYSKSVFKFKFTNRFQITWKIFKNSKNDVSWNNFKKMWRCDDFKKEKRLSYGGVWSFYYTNRVYTDLKSMISRLLLILKKSTYAPSSHTRSWIIE